MYNVMYNNSVKWTVWINTCTITSWIGLYELIQHNKKGKIKLQNFLAKVWFIPGLDALLSLIYLCQFQFQHTELCWVRMENPLRGWESLLAYYSSSTLLCLSGPHKEIKNSFYCQLNTVKEHLSDTKHAAQKWKGVGFTGSRVPTSSRVANIHVAPGDLLLLQLISRWSWSVSPRRWLLQTVDSMALYPAETPLLPKPYLSQASLPKAPGRQWRKGEGRTDNSRTIYTRQ